MIGARPSELEGAGPGAGPAGPSYDEGGFGGAGGAGAPGAEDDDIPF